jgi:hypothetical protein
MDSTSVITRDYFVGLKRQAEEAKRVLRRTRRELARAVATSRSLVKRSRQLTRKSEQTQTLPIAEAWDAKALAATLCSGSYQGNLHEELDKLTKDRLHELARAVFALKRREA